MQKNHANPEFQVICQNLANSKFFVASGGSFSSCSTDSSTPGTSGGNDSSTPEHSSGAGFTDTDNSGCSGDDILDF